MKTLKNVLFIDALSSGATGLILAIFPSYAAGIFGTSQGMPFAIIGILLTLFSALVLIQSRKNVMHKNMVKFIIAANALWVIESVAIIISQMFGFTAIGYFIIGAVAAWVAMMAILQTKGLKAFSVTTV